MQVKSGRIANNHAPPKKKLKAGTQGTEQERQVCRSKVLQQRIKIEKEVEQSRGGHVEQWAGGRCDEVWTCPRMRRKGKLEMKEETKQNVERAVTAGCAKFFVSGQSLYGKNGTQTQNPTTGGRTKGYHSRVIHCFQTPLPNF